MENTQTVQEEDKKPSRMSRGEKIFNWLVYGGIGGIGVFLATIPIAFWAKYGGGEKHFKASSDWLVKKGLSHETAEQTMITTATMQGGNLAVLPIKWAEDNKIGLITGINNIIGEKTDVAALQAEDKQSWGSILKARVTAWLIVFTSLKGFATAFGGDKFEKFETSFAKNIICKPFGKATHAGGQETKAFKYGRIAAIDVFATAAATTLLYFGSRFFAHLEKNKMEEKCADSVKETEIPHDEIASTMRTRANFAVRPKDASFTGSLNRRAETSPSYVLGA